MVSLAWSHIILAHLDCGALGRFGASLMRSLSEASCRFVGMIGCYVVCLDGWYVRNAFLYKMMYSEFRIPQYCACEHTPISVLYQLVAYV